MAILFLDFFGSDPSKMDQTRKFGEQTSRILEFRPEIITKDSLIKFRLDQVRLNSDETRRRRKYWNSRLE